MCMEKLLFVIFSPMPDIRKAINSLLLLLFSDQLNKKHAWSKLSVLPPWKYWMWNRSFIKSIFHFLKTVLFFEFARASSSSSFLFTNFSSKILKYPQPLVLTNFGNQLSSRFEGSSGSSYMLSSSSFCTGSFTSCLFLVHVCVW